MQAVPVNNDTKRGADMIVITKNINDIQTAKDLAAENVIILDMEMIQKDRQRVFDQVRALDVQAADLKAERARLLIETGMDGSGPEIGRINERLHNTRRCRTVFNGQREHFDFMLQYLAEKNRL